MKIKKSLSWLLILTMCVTLLPVIPVAAASNPEPHRFTTEKEFMEFADKQGSPDFLVVKYVAPGSDQEDTYNGNSTRIDFGAYKLNSTSTIDMRFRYDPDEAVLQWSNESYTGVEDLPVTDASSSTYTLFPKKLGSLASEGNESKYFFSNSDVGMSSRGSTVLDLPNGPLLTIGVESKAFTGKYGMMIGTPIEGIDAGLETIVPNLIGTFNNDGKNYFNTTKMDSVVYYSSIYFRESTKGAINSDTFGLFELSSNYTGGYALIGNGDVVTDQVAFIGFPQPETPKYPVKLTVQKTESDTTALNGASVVLTSSGGGITYPVSGNYVSNGSGLLMLDGTVVAEDGTEGSGILNLPQDTYRYTVTPPESETGLAAYEGTFKVDVSETPAEIPIYAQQKAVDAQDYTITIKDGESADDQKALSGAAVSFDGTSCGTTDDEGKITLTNKKPASYALDISKNKYITKKYASNNFTLNSDGTVTADGFTNNELILEQKRTNMTVQVKDSADKSLPTGTIVVIDKHPNGTVTENMEQNELPITKPIGADGTVSFSLPQGDYTYSIIAPGYEQGAETLVVVKEDSIVVGGTLREDGTVTDGTTINSSSSETENTVTLPKENVALPAENTSDPMYSVIGTWNSEMTEMTVKVYLKNLEATAGVFGMSYDTNIFSALKEDGSAFTINTELLEAVTDKHIAPDNEISATVNNPTQASGYHAFEWEAKAKAPVNGTAGPALIATYTLNAKTGLTPAEIRSKINSKSLMVRPYTKTAANTQIYTAFMASPHLNKEQLYQEYIKEYWRAVDKDNDDPVQAKRLSKDKASQGGFLQAMGTEAADGDVQPSDVMSQFVFNSYGNVGVSFTVLGGTDANPQGAISEATVTVKKGDTEVWSGKTDSYGEALTGLLQNTDYTYCINKKGYAEETDALAIKTTDQEVIVYLTTDKAHEVQLTTEAAVKATLLGSSRAPLQTDYYFSLEPKPGYTWKGGTLPAPSAITAQFVKASETPKDVSQYITWDTTKNKYKLELSNTEASAAVDESFAVVIGMAVDESIEPTDPTNPNLSNKVTATAGTGGTVSYTAPDGTNSTFGGITPNTPVSQIVEILGAAQDFSAVYQFKPQDPPEETNLEKEYEGTVIDKFYVNGVAIELTDLQRIRGKDYQLTGINKDQTMTATFATATIDPKDPNNPNDDIIVGPVTPRSDPVLSLTVGDYGSATVNTEDALEGAAQSDYSVSEGTATVTLEGRTNVAQPDGTSIDYQVDKVLVDEVLLNVTGASLTGAAWDSTSGMLTLSELKKGDIKNIVVTFKPEGQDSSIQALIKTVHRTGEGKVLPMGTSIYNVGDEPTINFAPETGWQMNQLLLEEPEAEKALDVTGAVNENAYKVPALKEGVTTLTYAFDEASYLVQVAVNYNMGSQTPIIPYRGATVTFERTAGGEPRTIQKTFSEPMTVTHAENLSIPKGTWRVTVSKAGYLKYVVEDFKIEEGGACADTAQGTDGDGVKTILFGAQTGSTDPKPIQLILGDASWDGELISMRDAAQVANGMVENANEARKKRSDIDESGTKKSGQYNLELDMSYVKESYGRMYPTTSYASLLGTSK